MNFDAFKQIENGKYKHVSDTFLQWFVGITEGDGSFIVAKRKGTERKELSFVITQATVDVQVLHMIQKTLSFGSVIKQGKRTSRYVIQNFSDLSKIISIVNGNVLLPYRQKQFAQFLAAFNDKMSPNKKSKGKPVYAIELRSCNVVPTKQNAWFSGFMDAEGCFTVSFLRGSATFRIRCTVSQKGRENLPLLSCFINMFGVGVLEPHSEPNNYTYVINGAANCLKVYGYFEAFALRTKKAERYSLWKEVHQQILQKNHLNFEIRQQLIEKAKQINKIQKSCAF